MSPLPSGTRYRWKKNKDGSKTRLAFGAGGKVLETASKPGEGELTDEGRKTVSKMPSSQRK